MGQSVRVIVVNTDAEVAADLRAVLLSIEEVRIVAEIDEPALLAQALGQLPAEVLLVHLDPDPAALMDVVGPLIEAYKGQIAAVAMTENRDAELVMRAMRAGMREFLWKPFPPERLAETLQRVGGELAAGGRRLGRLGVVVGASGGVGATQLAVNLAVELAQLDGLPIAEAGVGSGSGAASGRRPRVVVVDMDLRCGQLAMHLDAQPVHTIADLCETSEQIDVQMMERAMFKHPSGVQVLARPTELAQAERISVGQAAAVLAALQEHYDFVVVDLPAHFEARARVVFDMADTCLLVVQLLVPLVRNAERILRELASSGYALERVRLVCNRIGGPSVYLDRADVEATLKRRVEFVLPDEWKTSAAAVNMGAPLLTISPRSKLRQAYRQVALALAGVGEVAADDGQVKSSARGRKGLFSFLGGSKP